MISYSNASHVIHQLWPPLSTYSSISISSSPHTSSFIQQHNTNMSATPDNKDGTTIAAAPQVASGGYAFGAGGGQGTMAEQQRRAHLYVGNLSPRVTEQSELRGASVASERG